MSHVQPHWLLDLSQSTASVAGRFAAACIAALPEADEEEVLSPWLKCAAFSGGISTTLCAQLCPEASAVSWTEVAALPLDASDAAYLAASRVSEIDELGMKPLSVSSTHELLHTAVDGSLSACLALDKPFGDVGMCVWLLCCVFCFSSLDVAP